jgi:hypothetical protein
VKKTRYFRILCEELAEREEFEPAFRPYGPRRRCGEANRFLAKTVKMGSFFARKSGAVLGAPVRIKLRTLMLLKLRSNSIPLIRSGHESGKRIVEGHGCPSEPVAGVRVADRQNEQTEAQCQ